MLNRKHAILATAAFAALPMAANAATILFQYDLADLKVSATATGTYVAPSAFAGATLGGTAANPVLTVPIGTYIVYGIDAEVTNNNNLGLAAFQTGMTNSSLSATSTSVVLPGPTLVNPFFSSNAAAGNQDGLGGINPTLGTAGSYVAGGTTNASKSTYGANAFAELYGNQRVKPLATSNASFTLTLSNLPLAMQVISQGTNGSSPTYSNRTFVPGVDTMSAMPVLTVNYGATSTGTGSGTGTGTGTGSGAHAIVSLLNTAPPSYYGSQIGTPISITGKNGAYTVGNTGANASTGVTAGFTMASVFNPLTDTEVYALKLDQGAVPIAQGAAINTVIAADINGNASNVSASAIVPGSTAALLFPGYDVLLTSTAGFTAGAGGVAYLGLDFSQDATTTGVTVTEVAAVPEPATMAGAVLGAAGLLLGRRKAKIAA